MARFWQKRPGSGSNYLIPMFILAVIVLDLISVVASLGQFG